MGEGSRLHPTLREAAAARPETLWRGALDLVYPRRCMACEEALRGASPDYLCPACWRGIEVIGDDKCPRCAMRMGPHAEPGSCLYCRGRTLYFKGAAAFGLYQTGLRALIQRYKYHGCSFLARPLADLLASQLEREPFVNELELIVPAPLHWRRLLMRGYNQSALLAHALSRRLLVPAALRVLKRTRLTPPQAMLGASQRKRNLAGAFAARRPAAVKGKVVLLVDDVMTTCSTMAECAKTLLAAGAKTVYAATVAR